MWYELTFLVYLIFLLDAICFLIFQMRSMKRWMGREEIKELSCSEDISCILDELDNNEVAIKLSNVGPMSYGVLAKVNLKS